MIKTTAWTDYPFTELGDTPHDAGAPIREVTVLSYDGNKYCQITFNGIPLEVKVGYLYTECGRFGAPAFDVSCLKINTLHDRVSALEAAPRLFMVYKVLVTDFGGQPGFSYNERSSHIVGTYWTEKQAREVCAEQVPDHGEWPYGCPPKVVPTLALIVDGRCIEVSLGGQIAMSPTVP